MAMLAPVRTWDTSPSLPSRCGWVSGSSMVTASASAAVVSPPARMRNASVRSGSSSGPAVATAAERPEAVSTAATTCATASPLARRDGQPGTAVAAHSSAVTRGSPVSGLAGSVASSQVLRYWLRNDSMGLKSCPMVSTTTPAEALVNRNTMNPGQSFDSLFRDVTERLFGVYDDDTWVYPGHGKDTTLGAERPHLEEWRARGW
jgi:hypothetical protein